MFTDIYIYIISLHRHCFVLNEVKIIIWTFKKMNANWNGRHFEQYIWENTQKEDDE